jgi:hypothetical protein
MALSAMLKLGRSRPGTPAQPGPVELQEVDHIAVQQAVDHVAQRAAQDHATAKQNSFCVGWLRSIQTMKPEAASPADEEPALPARGAGQEGERRAGVVHAHEVEERRHRALSPSWK